MINPLGKEWFFTLLTCSAVPYVISQNALDSKRTGSVSSEDSPAEADEDQEDRQPSEERPQAAAKVGAKKQKKLEEKQARKAQREVTALPLNLTLHPSYQESGY